MSSKTRFGRSSRGFGAFIGLVLCTAAMLASAEVFPFFDGGWPVSETSTAATGAVVTAVSIGVRTAVPSVGCSLSTHPPALTVTIR